MRRETANVESVSGPPAVRDLRLERPEAPARTAVVVMGMHRSGTSVLTRVMSLLGCDLPRTLIPQGRNNEAGYWESRKITDLNDEILASAGTSWDDWTAFNPDWLRSPRAGSYKALLLQTLEQEFGNSPIFVVKDPRICRIPSIWLDALAEFGASVRIFHQIRSPVQVGHSLFTRNGIPPEVGHLLWLRHVLDAELGTRSVPRAFSSYHRLLKRGSGFVEEAASPLDIPWPRLTRRSADEIDAFIDADLQHHSDDHESVICNPSLSLWLRDAFAILAGWADHGEREEDHAALDDIRNELDAATKAFYGVVDAFCRTSRSLVAEMAERERLEATAEAAANEHEAVLSALRAEFEAAQAALHEVRAALADKTEGMKELEAQHGREMSARGRAEVALKNSESEKARTRGELAAAQERASRFAEERKSLQNKLEEVRAARASLQEKLQTIRAKRDALRDERNALRDERKKLQAGLERSDARRSALEERLSVAEAKVRRLEGVVSKLKEDESRARRTVGSLSRRLKSATILSTDTRKAAVREMGQALFASRQSRLPPLRYYALRRQAARLRASGALDIQWYLQANPDVAKAGIDPAVHYLVHGWKEGREPNGKFADLERRCHGREDPQSTESMASGSTDASG